MQLTQNMKEMLQELQSHAKHTYLEVSAWLGPILGMLICNDTTT